MHCYIINLPTATKRLERTRRELATYCPQLSWSVPPMFVASEMSTKEFEELYDSEKAWQFHKYLHSHGEVACALSHQSALKNFLKTDDNCCLIVEDDVLFSPAIGKFLDGLKDWMAKREEVPISVVLSEASAARYWTARPWINGIKRTRPINICGAFAYVINRAGAKLMLMANAVPIHTASDNWGYYGKYGLRVYGTNKLLAGSFDFSRIDSSLSKDREANYPNILARQVPVPFLKRKLLALVVYVRRIWWLLTGVVVVRNRTNVGLYRACDRLTECSND